MLIQILVRMLQHYSVHLAVTNTDILYYHLTPRKRVLAMKLGRSTNQEISCLYGI
jgi:hypothetical protein